MSGRSRLRAQLARTYAYPARGCARLYTAISFFVSIPVQVSRGGERGVAEELQHRA